jgi:hypothetical protein
VDWAPTCHRLILAGCGTIHRASMGFKMVMPFHLAHEDHVFDAFGSWDAVPISAAKSGSSELTMWVGSLQHLVHRYLGSCVRKMQWKPLAALKIGCGRRTVLSACPYSQCRALPRHGIFCPALFAECNLSSIAYTGICHCPAVESE